ncbi:Rieske 2Fe-2S domain-containing protein [Methylacidiphilales bacterium]|nr:Rieske 2Fe-2S domain-containing protein [Candidatus Methylacidiphilales bacterium]
MIAKSKDELVAKLTGAGFVFSQFSLINEGDYEPYDADWNYKDVPHLNVLHKLVNGYPARVEDGIITTIILQNVAGFVLPMGLVCYHSGKNRQTYYTSFLTFLLIVETTWESIGEIRTRVVTTYAVGSRWYLKFLHPIIQKLITRNYANLMADDVPMRTRRGQLRKWGYAFRTDGPPHSYATTLHILDENMVYKSELRPPKPVHLSMEQLAAARHEDILTTQSDHWGLRLTVEGDTLHVFPRLCPHEGACLDKQAIENVSMRCPWHGRILRPLTSISMPWPTQAAPIELRYHRLTLKNDGIDIEFKDVPIAAKVDPHEQIADINL